MAEESTNPFISKSVGNSDQQSKQKASAAMAQAEKARASADTESWPVGENGQPMMKITMTAAELIPTGQYANVSVGPAQITAFVDTDKVLDGEEAYFTKEQRGTMAKALNELAEIIEIDVVAVQRNLVLESMQNQVGNGNS
jgi:hypothetical protein